MTEDKWFYSFVKTAYEYALANGTSATTFSPDGKFTVAQALTAAANIHKAYFGGCIDTSVGGLWYMPYVDYCVANGIIKADQFKDYNAPITRGDMAIVFANILPDSEYTAIRDGSNPDVTNNLACYAAVQKLYLDGADAALMKGKRVLIVDDVISTGESLHALEALVNQAGGEIVGRMAILAEGEAQARTDLIYLEKLPVFNAKGEIIG